MHPDQRQTMVNVTYILKTNKKEENQCPQIKINSNQISKSQVQNQYSRKE